MTASLDYVGRHIYCFTTAVLAGLWVQQQQLTDVD